MRGIGSGAQVSSASEYLQKNSIFFVSYLTRAECHHAASDTIINVLCEVRAKYVYGVTATPKRGDGLEKINEMLLDPVRFHYTSKERAMAQGIRHLVYPRFTRTVAARGAEERKHINEAYEIIRNNAVREELIISDIEKAVKMERTPVILSRYKDLSERFYERLKGYADHVFLNLSMLFGHDRVCCFCKLLR